MYNDDDNVDDDDRDKDDCDKVEHEVGEWCCRGERGWWVWVSLNFGISLEFSVVYAMRRKYKN